MNLILSGLGIAVLVGRGVGVIVGVGVLVGVTVGVAGSGVIVGVAEIGEGLSARVGVEGAMMRLGDGAIVGVASGRDVVGAAAAASDGVGEAMLLPMTVATAIGDTVPEATPIRVATGVLEATWLGAGVAAGDGLPIVTDGDEADRAAAGVSEEVGEPAAVAVAITAEIKTVDVTEAAGVVPAVVAVAIAGEVPDVDVRPIGGNGLGEPGAVVGDGKIVGVDSAVSNGVGAKLAVPVGAGVVMAPLCDEKAVAFNEAVGSGETVRVGCGSPWARALVDGTAMIVIENTRNNARAEARVGPTIMTSLQHSWQHRTLRVSSSRTYWPRADVNRAVTWR